MTATDAEILWMLKYQRDQALSAATSLIQDWELNLYGMNRADQVPTEGKFLPDHLPATEREFYNSVKDYLTFSKEHADAEKSLMAEEDPPAADDPLSFAATEAQPIADQAAALADANPNNPALRASAKKAQDDADIAQTDSESR